jgi:DNA-binding transcriptional LysR family regulator
MPEDLALSPIADGKLTRVLDDWCPPFAGYHLYYPSRRHVSPAFGVLVEALRFREKARSSVRTGKRER